MEIYTILLIILAAIFSLALALYQYYSRIRKERSPYLYLMLLRFIGLFAIGLLLINPGFTKEQYYLEKSNLVLLVDNSSSIANAEAADLAVQIVEDLESNNDLADKFDISRLSFGRELSASDSLEFNKEVTNLEGALSTASRSYKGKSAAFVLLSDGNQTIGSDYQYLRTLEDHAVFPVVLGDTTQYEDILIEQVNVNNYAFLDNQYPLEIFVRYQGSNTINSSVSVRVDGTTRYKEAVRLNGQNNAVKLDVLLRAGSVGVKRLMVDIEALNNERNTANNSQEFAIEVIDEKTTVAIVSSLNHPDLGALKKSIESNNQRRVKIVNPQVDLAELEDAEVFVLYQPGRGFEKIYQFIENKRAGSFTITGPATNWRLLNGFQNSFQKNSFNQSEEVSPVVNPGFSTFDISDFTAENYPPLQTTLGDLILAKPAQIIANQRIKGVDLQEPLLTIIEGDRGREVVLFGENIWKWRMQDYRNENSFQVFDELISKLILYLSSDNTRQRLNIDYETIYRNASSAILRASYFDETFVIDGNASITVFISGKDNDFSRQIPMLFRGTNYQADLSTLPAGDFNFTVRVEDEEIMKSGQFTILDFDLEKQLTSSNYLKLERLANNTGGRSYFPSQSDVIIADLLASESYRPTQKSEQNIVSLIDFKILLAIVITAFAAEWFIRKYNGLI